LIRKCSWVIGITQGFTQLLVGLSVFSLGQSGDNAFTAIGQENSWYVPDAWLQFNTDWFSACKEFIEALEECHARGWAKFLGLCNKQKTNLNECLRDEVLACVNESKAES